MCVCVCVCECVCFGGRGAYRSAFRRCIESLPTLVSASFTLSSLSLLVSLLSEPCSSAGRSGVAESFDSKNAPESSPHSYNDVSLEPTSPSMGFRDCASPINSLLRGVSDDGSSFCQTPRERAHSKRLESYYVPRQASS